MNTQWTRTPGEHLTCLNVDTGAQYAFPNEMIDPCSDISCEELSEVEKSLQLFKTTPKYKVLSKYYLPILVHDFATCQVDNQLLADMKSLYDAMIIGVSISRAEKKGITDVDKVEARAHEIIKWLESTDFYEAPASTQYHESHPGGLLLHTLVVTAKIIELADCPVWSEKVDISEAVLVALVHDWCKINKYEKYERNVKNEKTGAWEKVPSYRHRDDCIVSLGHGQSSAYLASKMFKLSLEEYSAITFHMGRWESQSDYQINDLQRCNLNNPLNFLLQFADQVACTKYWYK